MRGLQGRFPSCQTSEESNLVSLIMRILQDIKNGRVDLLCTAVDYLKLDKARMLMDDRPTVAAESASSFFSEEERRMLAELWVEVATSL